MLISGRMESLRREEASAKRQEASAGREEAAEREAGAAERGASVAVYALLENQWAIPALCMCREQAVFSLPGELLNTSHCFGEACWRASTGTCESSRTAVYVQWEACGPSCKRGLPSAVPNP